MAAPTYSQQFSIGLLGTVGNVLSQPMNFYRCTVCGSVVAEGQTGTAGRDLHTRWHADLDAVASNASAAVTTANAVKSTAEAATTTANGAKTTADAASKTASTAATDAASAKTTAGTAATDASSAKATAGTAASTATKAASDAAAAGTAASGAQKAAADANQMAGRAMTVATDTDAALHQIDVLAKSAIDVAQAALPATEVTLCPLCRVAVKTELLRTHLTYHYRRAHGDPVEFPEDFDPTTADLSEVDPPMRTNMA